MKIGFIGLGDIGKPIALRVLQGGYDLAAYARRKDSAAELLSLGAGWADSPESLARQSDVVLTCLPGPVEVDEIVFGPEGLLKGMNPGSVYIALETSSPSRITRIHDAFLSRGVDVLDSPVSGGARGANAGSLAVWVGGAKPAFEKVEAVLRCFGNKITWMGQSGTGSSAKLLHQMALFGTYQVLGEVRAIAKQQGLSAEDLRLVLQSGAFGQNLLDKAMFTWLFNDVFDWSLVKSNIARKDQLLGLALARESHVDTPLADIVEQKMQKAGLQDTSGIAALHG